MLGLKTCISIWVSAVVQQQGNYLLLQVYKLTSSLDASYPLLYLAILQPNNGRMPERIPGKNIQAINS